MSFGDDASSAPRARKMFSGFTSRWTTPRAWAAARAAATGGACRGPPRRGARASSSRGGRGPRGTPRRGRAPRRPVARHLAHRDHVRWATRAASLARGGSARPACRRRPRRASPSATRASPSAASKTAPVAPAPPRAGAGSARERRPHQGLGPRAAGRRRARRGPEICAVVGIGAARSYNTPSPCPPNEPSYATRQPAMASGPQGRPPRRGDRGALPPRPPARRGRDGRGVGGRAHAHAAARGDQAPARRPGPPRQAVKRMIHEAGRRAACATEHRGGARRGGGRRRDGVPRAGAAGGSTCGATSPRGHSRRRRRSACSCL